MNVIQQDLDRAIAKEPRLAARGIVSSPRGAAFRENREQLRQQLKQFQFCVGFLSQCEVSKRISRQFTSYAVKHVIEEWAKIYIPNGSVIAALIHLQIPYKHKREWGLNVFPALLSKNFSISPGKGERVPPYPLWLLEDA